MPVPVFTSGEVLTAANMNQVGLWLVKTQTIGTSVSSQAVTNAFSASYDNYLITVNGGTASTASSISLQLGSTTTGYYEGRPGINITNGAYVGNVTNNGASFITGQYTTTGKHMATTLTNPFLNTETRQFSQGFNMDTGSASLSYGLLNNALSYTGFTLFALAGTWTGGTIRVYGYRQ